MGCVNAKCNDCKEPTKYVVGFWDGENDSHGCLYDCKNIDCETKKLLDVLAEQRENERSDVANENWKNSIVAKNITVARNLKSISIYELSTMTGISSADISAYENEKKAVPVTHYINIMESISKYDMQNGELLKIKLLDADEFNNLDNGCFKKIYEAVHGNRKDIDTY